MKPRILVFPNFRSPSAQGKYSRLLISVYISGLAWTTRIACFFAENQFSLILLPDALRNLVPASSKVVFYGDFFGDAEAALTYEALHRYADEIDQKMLENNLFTESHQSLARISETRWIAWINDNILLDLKILEIAIERFGKSRVQMVGAPNFPVFSALRTKYSVTSWWPGCLVTLFLLPLKKFKNGALHRIVADDIESWTPPEIPPSKTENKNLPRLIFVGQLERTIRRLDTLLRALPTPHPWEIWLIFYGRKGGEITKLLENLSKHGIKIRYLSQYLNQKDFSEIRSRGFEDFNRIKSLLADIPCQWHGFNLAHTLSAYWESESFEMSRIAGSFTRAMARFDAEILPDLLVHFEEQETNRSLCAISQKRGALNFSAYFLSPVGFVSLVRRLPNFLLGSGSFLVQQFTNAGNWPETKTRIIGDPALDSVGEKIARTDLSKIREAFGFSKDEKILLLLTAYAFGGVTDALLEKAYQNVCLAARAKGFRVAVKVHPMQELHRVKEVFSTYCPDAFFFQAEDLTDLSLASDFAVIINFSTAIPLVASARIPLLVMVPDEMQEKLSKFYGINSIKNFELSPLSASPAFYQELIDRFSQDLDWRKLRIEGQSAYGELHNGPIDGFSAKRFWQALQDFSSQKGEVI